MKKTHTLLPLLGWALLTTCRESNPIPEPEWAPVVTAAFPADTGKSYLNFQDLAGSAFEFELGYQDFGKPLARVASIDLFLQYNNAPTKVPLGTYDAFPARVALTAAEAAAKFGRSLSQLALGDRFTFSFVVRSEDGRVFDAWASNICNLAGVEGICSLDALVLNPAVVVATPGAVRSFSQAAIAAGSAPPYRFSLDQRTYGSTTSLRSVDVNLRYRPAGGATTGAFLLRQVTAFPASVMVTAPEAAKALGVPESSFKVGDTFTVSFTVRTADGKSFTNFGAGNNLCGTNFPTNVRHPLNYPVENPRIEDQARLLATPVAGTCSLTWSVER